MSQYVVWLQSSSSRSHRRGLALTQGSQTPRPWKDMIRLQTLGEVNVGLPCYTFGGTNWWRCSRTQRITLVKLWGKYTVMQWKGKNDETGKTAWICIWTSSESSLINIREAIACLLLSMFSLMSTLLWACSHIKSVFELQTYKREKKKEYSFWTYSFKGWLMSVQGTTGIKKVACRQTNPDVLEVFIHDSKTSGILWCKGKHSLLQQILNIGTKTCFEIQ